MKNLIILITVSLIANFAQALSVVQPVGPQPPLIPITADIVDFNINHAEFEGVTEGTITIDDSDINLTITDKVECPPGATCILGFAKYITKKFPITNVKTSGCGETIYTAKMDNTLSGGNQEFLQVIDSSTMFCEIYLEHLTSVSYVTVEPGNLTSTVSVFNANKLQAIQFKLPNADDITFEPAADAESLPLQSQLYNFDVADGHRYLEGINDGFISFSGESIHLNLMQVANCAAGTACVQGFNKYVTKEFRIVSESTNGCGVKIYEAKQAYPTIAAVSESLKVYDYTNLECKFRPAAATVVEFKTLNINNPLPVISVFFGEALAEADLTVPDDIQLQPIFF